MLNSEALKQELEHRYILLDTNVLIKAAQYQNTGFFDKIFAPLYDSGVSLLINEPIRFEYLKGCKTKEQVETRNMLLKYLTNGASSLPFKSDSISQAINISNVYSNKNYNDNQISLVDCLISAHLYQYAKNLFVITQDYKDFPTVLHDRIHEYTIDTGKEILLFVVCKFNTESYEKSLSEIP